MKHIIQYKIFELGQAPELNDEFFNRIKEKRFDDEVGYIWSVESRKDYTSPQMLSHYGDHMMFNVDYSVHRLPTENDHCSYSLLRFGFEDLLMTYLGCEFEEMCLFSPRSLTDRKIGFNIEKYKIATKLYRVTSTDHGSSDYKSEEVKSYEPYNIELKRLMKKYSKDEDYDKIPPSWHITGTFYKHNNLKWINLDLGGAYIFIEEKKIPELLELIESPEWHYHKY